MEFGLAIQGNLQKVAASRKLACLQALKAATTDSVNVTKTSARRDVERAFQSRRIANTIRGDVYPKRGLAYEPLGMVYSKAPHIIGPHADGGTIRAASGSLLIPVKGSPAETLRLKRGQTRREAAEQKFGKLIYIERPGKTPFLAAKVKATNAGGLVPQKSLKPLKKKQGPRSNVNAIVPLFRLAQNVRLKKRLRTRDIFARGQRRHPARVAYHLSEHLAASEKETAL